MTVDGKMTTLTEAAFLEWADAAGLGLDPQYPHSAALIFRQDSGGRRFWETPTEPEVRPYFISSLLELMGEWRECFVWRHLGSWPDAINWSQINEVVERQILDGIGMPLGTRDVVSFSKADVGKLITLIFSTTIFAWSVGEDLYIVPDHARYILATDHHNVIHVAFRDAADVDGWVRTMEERGFALPEGLPDATFKKPEWMP